ncbi:MAG: FAD-dependent monooxygenase [Actinomycetota bacterium]|nr:FAD-dependent monooxygenase [Actinomycetota bacterium]MDA2972807.1 FAD-dependent monooxygenase [Actinomycetota bacterium]MDA3000617.1 FAD-dependent monooxygenase [Actinomycetota bacterium]
MTHSDDEPIVIVGAGPVGLTAARLITNAARRCVVLERREGPQRNPAAHVVNSRTLEIFRHAGFDMEKIMAIAQAREDAGHVNFVSRLNGRLIGRLPFERQGDDILALTPHPLRNISQHRLEPLLAEQLKVSDLIDLRYDTEWVSAIQTPLGVDSLVRDRCTGKEFTIRGAWLLGADGAGSAVRKWLGIEMIGPASLQSFVAIHFRGSLRGYVADRPGALHFVMDPAVQGTFIAHDVDRESVFMVGFDPTQESLDDYDAKRCARIVRGAIGDEGADVEIVDVGTWHMTAQVAEHVRQARVFLIGDAAHRFPPTGGMGLNTGIADAHNLVWKILAVDDGLADASLLSSYESERRPVAESNCNQSLSNAFKMIVLAEALGLHPEATTSDLDVALADPERSSAIASAVQEQATHFDMLGLQLGYVYETRLNPGRPTPVCEIDPTPFTPSNDIGSRLIHGWLSDGRSTLDLVDPHRLTLLSFGDHDTWSRLTSESDVSIHCVRIGTDVIVAGDWTESCRVGTSGAILVRPDQHVAWIWFESPEGESVEFRSIVRTVLGK